MTRTRFYHAYTYAAQSNSWLPVECTTEAGRFCEVILSPSRPLTAEKEIDCGGRLLLPGFVDSHLHLPGSQLYQRYGINLMGLPDLPACETALWEHRQDQGVLRGFGWSQRLFQKDKQALEKFRLFLDETFPELPVALFSDDYHSCLCNRRLMEDAAPLLSAAGQKADHGLLTERSVFALLEGYPALSFSSSEIRDALLAYQNLLLSRGITAVQALMPIGMGEENCLEALWHLEKEGLWHLKVNFAVTAHPSENLHRILARLRRWQQRQSFLVRINTVKIYIDGVVDNGSACLLRPYTDGSNGRPIWTDKKLEDFCLFFDREGVQLHAHVIGDAAAEQITRALQKALRANGRSSNVNRHTLAHCQLADKAAAERMAQLGLYAALQPFWFAFGKPYPVDTAKLGLARAERAYPCASLLRQGVNVAFGSDSPVTPDPSPLLGISCAVGRSRSEERLTLGEALAAFTVNGRRQLWQEKEAGGIAPGMQADFVLIEPRAANPPELWDFSRAFVAETYIGAQKVYPSQTPLCK